MMLVRDQDNTPHDRPLTPEESRTMARQRIGELCPRWRAVVRYTDWGLSRLLELVVDFDSQHQQAPEDLASRLVYCPVPYFRKAIVRTDLWVELYPVKASAPPFVRFVRKGFDPRQPGRHYDLAECFFRISPDPVELWTGVPGREAERMDQSYILAKCPGTPFGRPPLASDLLQLAATATQAWAYVPGARVNFRAMSWDRRFVPVGCQRREAA